MKRQLVPAVLLAVLSSACTGLIGDFAASDDAEVPELDLPGEPGSGTLYEANCEMCHGPIEQTTVHHPSVDRITSAIANVSIMAPLSRLTRQEIELIVAELEAAANVRNAVCDQQATLPPGQLFRLSKQQYANVVSDVTGLANVVTHLASWPSDTVVGTFRTAGALLEVDTQLLAALLPATESILDAVWASTTARNGMLGCNLSTSGCAAGAIERFVRRAAKRDVPAALVTRHVNAFNALVTAGETRDDAFKIVIQTILVSPSFLFAAYVDGSRNAERRTALTDLEIAHRLSLIVWGHLPDTELLAAAGRGDLRNPATLPGVVSRMVKDPKASFLANELFEQWIIPTRFVGEASTFSTLDAAAKNAMLTETRDFFAELVATDQPLAALITGGSNAAQYPVGILGHASVLSLTGRPEHQLNVIHRGNWLRRTLLCQTAPPPVNLNEVLAETSEQIADGLNTRELSELRIENPACATCHRAMDAVGFTFEGFDSFGETIAGTVDDDGELSDGTVLSGVTELRDWMTTQDSARQCFAQYLSAFTYERNLETDDYCVANRIGAERWDQPLSAWIADLTATHGFAQVQ